VCDFGVRQHSVVLVMFSACMQDGHFDVADRLFNSVPDACRALNASSLSEVKELTPELVLNAKFSYQSQPLFIWRLAGRIYCW